MLNSFNLKANGAHGISTSTCLICRFRSLTATIRFISKLARVARTAEEVVKAVPEKKGEYFTRTRKRVRSALAKHGIAAELELLVKRLLGRSPNH